MQKEIFENNNTLMGIFEVSLHTLPVRFKTLTVDPVTGLEEGVVRKAVNDVARTYTIPIGNVAPDTFVALTKDQKSVIAAYGRRGNGTPSRLGVRHITASVIFRVPCSGFCPAWPSTGKIQAIDTLRFLKQTK